VDSIIGYFDNEQDADTLNAAFNSSFTAWVLANRADLVAGTKNAVEYFDTNPPIYEAAIKTSSIGGLNISLITLNDL
jgi:hypothetical protein